MFCPQCGKKLAGTEKFCPNCGFDLARPSMSAAAVTAGAARCGAADPTDSTLCGVCAGTVLAAKCLPQALFYGPQGRDPSRARHAHRGSSYGYSCLSAVPHVLWLELRLLRSAYRCSRWGGACPARHCHCGSSHGASSHCGTSALLDNYRILAARDLLGGSSCCSTPLPPRTTSTLAPASVFSSLASRWACSLSFSLLGTTCTRSSNASV